MADSKKQVKKIKNFLLAQFAAECYLDDLDYHDGSGLSFDTLDAMHVDTEHDYDKSNTLTGRLALGANQYDLYSINDDGSKKDGVNWSATLATKVMINDLAKEWKIVDQISNQNSGFSATLLYSEEYGYTLSFRSTESKKQAEYNGDQERDSLGANKEIKDTGFAWAQIMDMEEYLEHLMKGELASKGYKEDSAVKNAFTASDFQLNLTGYSLGAHLAQTFTGMHYDLVNEVMIFNGAGMGEFTEDGDSPTLQETGETLAAAIGEIRASYDDIIADINGDIEGYLNTLTDEEMAEFLGIAGDEIVLIRSVMKAEILEPYNKSVADDNIYEDPFYQHVQKTVLEKYPGTSSFAIGLKELLPWVDECIISDPKISNLYGHGDTDDTEFVAGSGKIYGSWDSIFIEDQVWWNFDEAENASWANTLFRSIGPTHSISLVMDSIFLTETLMEISPTTLVSREQVEHLLYSPSSSERAATFADDAESSSLENILNAVGRILYGDEGQNKWENSPVEDTKEGFASLKNRNLFYENIKKLRVWKENYGTINIEPLWESKEDEDVLAGEFEPISNQHKYTIAEGRAQEIADLAKTNIAYRYALENLIPLVIDDASLYDKFNENGELDENNNDLIGDYYFLDRAEFLVNILQENLNNTGTGIYDPSAPHNYYKDLGNGREQYFTFENDQNFKLSEYNQRIFGTDGEDEIITSDGSDHLYESSPKSFSPHRAVFSLAA